MSNQQPTFVKSGFYSFNDKDSIRISIEHCKALKAKLMGTRGKSFFVFIIDFRKKTGKKNGGHAVEIPVGDITTLAEAKKVALTVYDIIHKQNHWK